MAALNSPYGGELVQLIAGAEQQTQAVEQARSIPSWDLTPRQECDLELLINGGFSPLLGFLGRTDYESVCADMRLADGTLWPIPIVLDVSEAFAASIETGSDVALRDPEGVLIALLHVQDIWCPDLAREAGQIYATDDQRHPGVRHTLRASQPVYLGGPVTGIELPIHYDFKARRYTPAQLRETFERLGWRRVVAFHTRNPIHRAQRELTFRAAQQAGANLLLHPVVGMTRPGDIDYFTRVRCYEQVIETYPEQTTLLALLPLAMRMAGPREALWHAIIRKNFGCSHFIVGRNHAGSGDYDGRGGNDGPYAAQQLVQRHGAELGIEILPIPDMVYVRERGRHIPFNEARADEKTLFVSGAELRQRLREGTEIPSWFSYPPVIEELRRTYPPRHAQGLTVFFTGLSGAGKSTLANALVVKLMEMGGRPVTLLDGDIVRKNLSSELGFSREHRDLNILRIGFVASEITKNRGIAVCAPIAPYRHTRDAVRELIESVGGFIEVHVATPLEECERRDRKGLYAKARAGLIKGFTGIDDPYETPENPEVRIDTRDLSPDQAAQSVLLNLESLGYVS